MSQTGWGKPKYGSETFKKTGKPRKEPGDNFIRILPPMFSLAAAGKWAVYKTTHWGFSGVHPSDKHKTIVRPFLCIEETRGRERLVIKACPECEDYKVKLKERDQKKAELEKAGKTPDEIKVILKGRNDWLQAHGPERKWYMNVKYKDGTFGDYKVNHKIHKKGIDAKLAEVLAKYKFDGIEPDGGIWINIKRIGNGFDPPDVVEFGTKTVKLPDGSEAEQIERAPLSQEDWDQAVANCRDLSTLGGAVLDYAQIAALVASGGDPEQVDKIFGGAVGAAAAAVAPSSPVEDDDEPSNEPPPTSAVSAVQSVLAAAPAAAAAASAPAVDEDAEVRARYEQLKAKMAADMAAEKAAEDAKKAAAAAAAAATPDPKLVKIESDTDFIKAFEERERRKAAAAAGSST